MAKDQPPDQTGENEDIDDVLSTLDGVAARTATGAVVGMMAIFRDRNGNDFCVSAGWYGRNPDQGLLPAMAGLVQMCGPAGSTQSHHELVFAAPTRLH